MKRRLATLYAHVFTLFFCSSASAQTCPHGYMPLGGPHAGWSGCAPLTASNQPPPDPGPQWATRWGAIAIANGAFGSSHGMSSKRQAEKSAIKACKANGGESCKTRMTFYNQCAALAWGENYNVSFRSPELADAEQSAVKECQEKTQDCKIFFSACSYPERIR